MHKQDVIARKLLIVGLLTLPLVFFWTLEISISSGPYPMTCKLFGPLTNGFFVLNGCRAYHISMYLLMIVNTVAALYVSSRMG